MHILCIYLVNMRKKIIIPATAALFALVFSSCATNNTPTTRISKSPEIFQQLSPSDQELAKQGKVKEGMTKNAVLIAWGEPSKINKGSKDGAGFEKWYYATSTPVYNSSVSVGIGHGGFGRRGFGKRGFGRRYRRHGSFGYGGFGARGGFGYGGYRSFGLGTSATYVRSVSSVVEFDAAGKVTNWSQTN